MQITHVQYGFLGGICPYPVFIWICFKFTENLQLKPRFSLMWDYLSPVRWQQDIFLYTGFMQNFIQQIYMAGLNDVFFFFFACC